MCFFPVFVFANGECITVYLLNGKPMIVNFGFHISSEKLSLCGFYHVLLVQGFKSIDGSAMLNDLTIYYLVNVNACERQSFVRRLYPNPFSFMSSFHDKFRNDVISILVLPEYPHRIVWICLL